MKEVKIKKLKPEAEIPTKANSSDACFDVWATSREWLGNNRWKYGLGFAVAIPEGYRFDLKPRSSIHQTGLILANSTGTIDHLYRKEWFAVFYHVITELPPYEIGDKIGQITIEKVLPVEFEEVEEIEATERGGFGSTGKR